MAQGRAGAQQVWNLIDVGHGDDALALARDLLAEFPEDVDAIKAYAFSLDNAGDREEALNAALAVVDIDPADPDAHYIASRSLRFGAGGQSKRKRLKWAKAHAEAAVALRPDVAHFWRELLVVQSALEERWKHRRATLERAQTALSADDFAPLQAQVGLDEAPGGALVFVFLIILIPFSFGAATFFLAISLAKARRSRSLLAQARPGVSVLAAETGDPAMVQLLAGIDLSQGRTATWLQRSLWVANEDLARYDRRSLMYHLMWHLVVLLAAVLVPGYLLIAILGVGGAGEGFDGSAPLGKTIVIAAWFGAGLVVVGLRWWAINAMLPTTLRRRHALQSLVPLTIAMLIIAEANPGYGARNQADVLLFVASIPGRIVLGLTLLAAALRIIGPAPFASLTERSGK